MGALQVIRWCLKESRAAGNLEWIKDEDQGGNLGPGHRLSYCIYTYIHIILLMYIIFFSVSFTLYFPRDIFPSSSAFLVFPHLQSHSLSFFFSILALIFTRLLTPQRSVNLTFIIFKVRFPLEQHKTNFINDFYSRKRREKNINKFHALRELVKYNSI